VQNASNIDGGGDAGRNGASPADSGGQLLVLWFLSSANVWADQWVMAWCCWNDLTHIPGGTAMDLDSFKPDHWWNIVAAAGAVIAVAAVPAQFTAAFLIGLGLLLFGAGEWVNRPRQTQVKGTKVVGLFKGLAISGNQKCTAY
jgi:hypothetical protein